MTSNWQIGIVRNSEEFKFHTRVGCCGEQCYESGIGINGSQVTGCDIELLFLLSLAIRIQCTWAVGTDCDVDGLISSSNLKNG